MSVGSFIFFFFFFNDTATTEIYTLSLHDALPILVSGGCVREIGIDHTLREIRTVPGDSVKVIFIARDRKSTRLNSSHGYISYAVFCLKKKKHNTTPTLVSSSTVDVCVMSTAATII